MQANSYSLVNAPHVVIRAYDFLVLYALNLVLLINAVVQFFRHQWIIGGTELVACFGIAVIGQTLRENTSRVANRNGGLGKKEFERYGEMTSDESWHLAKALSRTAVLIGTILAFLAWYKGQGWLFSLATFFGGLFVFPAASMVFCFAWAWYRERTYGRSQQSRIVLADLRAALQMEQNKEPTLDDLREALNDAAAPKK